jgi:hypothetical protein
VTKGATRDEETSPPEGKEWIKRIPARSRRALMKTTRDINAIDVPIKESL